MPDSAERPQPTHFKTAFRVALGAFTLACAVAAGWLDLRGVDPETTLLGVAGAAFLLAVAVPGWGALAGGLIGFGVPLAHLYARLAGIDEVVHFAHATKGYYPIAAAVGGLIVGLAVRTATHRARQWMSWKRLR